MFHGRIFWNIPFSGCWGYLFLDPFRQVSVPLWWSLLRGELFWRRGEHLGIGKSWQSPWNYAFPCSYPCWYPSTPMNIPWISREYPMNIPWIIMKPGQTPVLTSQPFKVPAPRRNRNGVWRCQRPAAAAAPAMRWCYRSSWVSIGSSWCLKQKTWWISL